MGVPTQSICIYFIIHSLVGLFQAKLELLTGGSVGSMKVTVLDKENQLVCNLDNNDALLGSYPIDSGMIIHVCEMNINCVCIHLSVCLSACICLYMMISVCEAIQLSMVRIFQLASLRELPQ